MQNCGFLKALQDLGTCQLFAAPIVRRGRLFATLQNDRLFATLQNDRLFAALKSDRLFAKAVCSPILLKIYKFKISPCFSVFEHNHSLLLTHLSLFFKANNNNFSFYYIGKTASYGYFQLDLTSYFVFNHGASKVPDQLVVFLR